MSIATTSIGMLDLTGKALVYPLSETTGQWFCYTSTYLFLGGNMHSNFLTFFLTLFRYICIFHEDKLLKWNLSPKKLGQVLVGSHIFLSTLLAIVILQASPSPRNLDACLGHYEQHFYADMGQNVCTAGGFVLNILCKMSILLHMILSSNIPEAFMLYACFKAIRDQNERAKDMISEKHYHLRKRDNGIVISISIIQWILELINFIFYYIYIHFLYGNSNIADKFYSLFVITFTLIIQPGFYLTGDSEFRRNLDQNGLSVAMKEALRPLFD